VVSTGGTTAATGTTGRIEALNNAEVGPGSGGVVLTTFVLGAVVVAAGVAVVVAPEDPEEDDDVDADDDEEVEDDALELRIAMSPATNAAPTTAPPIEDPLAIPAMEDDDEPESTKSGQIPLGSQVVQNLPTYPTRQVHV
jgi:hypothetical protein